MRAATPRKRGRMQRKFYVSNKKYGEALAEQIAQALHAEKPHTATYQVAVGPVDSSKLETWAKHEEEHVALDKRAEELAKAKGWTQESRRPNERNH